MNNNITILEKVLKKLGFIQPIPEDVQKLLLKYNTDELIITLRKFNQYSFAYGIVLRTYFLAKRTGIRISILHSKIIAGLTASVIISLIAAGIIYVYQLITKEDIAVPEKREQVSEKKHIKKREKKSSNLPIDKPVKKERKYTAVDTRLGINTIKSAKEDAGIASEITRKLYNNLSKAKGKNRVVYRKLEGTGKSVNRQLTGRLTRLGKTKIIAISIVDSQSGKSLMETAMKYKQDEEIKEKIDELVDKIIKKSSIWNIKE